MVLNLHVGERTVIASAVGFVRPFRVGLQPGEDVGLRLLERGLVFGLLLPLRGHRCAAEGATQSAYALRKARQPRTSDAAGVQGRALDELGAVLRRFVLSHTLTPYVGPQFVDP